MTRISDPLRWLERAGYLLAGLVFLYLYLPIGLLVVNSFNSSKYPQNWEGFSWVWYQRLWNNQSLMDAFLHSLTVALTAATLATLIGTLMALAIYRYRFPFKRSAMGLLFVLMMSPDIVLGITFLMMVMALGLSGGYWSLLLSHTTFCLPFVVITLYAQLKGFDLAMVEAAQDLGAGEWHIFRRILLPLVRPAVVAAWLLAFTLSLDDVIVSSFVTGPGYEILPIRVFSMVKVGVSPEVNALATLLLAISLLAVTLAALLVNKKENL